MPLSAPHQQAAADAYPCIDRSALLARIGGDPALMRHLLVLFFNDFSGVMPALHKALAGGDAGVAIRIVHKVKGAAASLAAGELQRTAAMLEARLRGKGSGELSSFLAEFQRALERVLTVAQQAGAA